MGSPHLRRSCADSRRSLVATRRNTDRLQTCRRIGATGYRPKVQSPPGKAIPLPPAAVPGAAPGAWPRLPAHGAFSSQRERFAAARSKAVSGHRFNQNGDLHVSVSSRVNDATSIILPRTGSLTQSCLENRVATTCCCSWNGPTTHNHRHHLAIFWTLPCHSGKVEKN